jgi:hypothetical protein
MKCGTKLVACEVVQTEAMFYQPADKIRLRGRNPENQSISLIVNLGTSVAGDLRISQSRGTGKKISHFSESYD